MMTKKIAQKTNKPKLAPIIDNTTSRNQGIIIVNQQAMQDIFTKSGPNAKTNEFQVHYWSLNLRYKAPDDSILDICIPTCYFNYKQEVSGARIDFELKDVIEISNKVLPIHNMKVNQLKPFIDQLSAMFKVPFELSSQPYNSIHRHPGSSHSQSFSGTDLDKKANDHGVVYPFDTVSNDTPNFAGIMAIDSGTCNVAHYEYRTANGKLGQDLTYTQGRCTAIIIDPQNQTSEIESLFGYPQKPNYKLKEKNSEIPLSLVQAITNLLQDYSPSTDAINPANVTKKTYTQSQYSWPKTPSYQEISEPAPEDTIKLYEGITVYDEKHLLAQGKPFVVKELNTLYNTYYGKHSKISASDEDQLEDLLEEYEFIKEAIIDEYNEATAALSKSTPVLPTIAQMKKELLDAGAIKTKLDNASDHLVESWHKMTFQ